MHLKQDQERKQFQEIMKQKVKQHKAELKRVSRGQSKEAKLQLRAEQEAELAKKACSLLLLYTTHHTLIVPHASSNTSVL